MRQEYPGCRDVPADIPNCGCPQGRMAGEENGEQAQGLVGPVAGPSRLMCMI